jgi:hypothetical protein
MVPNGTIVTGGASGCGSLSDELSDDADSRNVGTRSSRVWLRESDALDSERVRLFGGADRFMRVAACGRGTLSQGKDKRRHPRFGCCGYAKVQIPSDPMVHSAKILNLSLEGCLIEVMTPIEKLEPVLDLTFTVNQLPFYVRGHIRYVRADRMIGFQFMQLSSRAREQLTDLLEELAEESAKHPHVEESQIAC